MGIKKLNNITVDELKEMVKSSSSRSDILRKLDCRCTHFYLKKLDKQLENLDIDKEHLYSSSRFVCKNNKMSGKAKPISLLLTINSSCQRTYLKNRLIKENYLENKCNICGQLPEWKNKKLVMVLDHINGIYNDNRLENLRLLCPNCNSQTDTFSGRKNKIIINCKECNEIISKHSNSGLCRNCISKYRSQIARKIKNRPSLDILLKQVEEIGYRGTGRFYNVTYNTIQKWIRLYKKMTINGAVGENGGHASL